MKRVKDDSYIETGYKFRIYPTEEQKAFFEKSISRDLQNLYLV